MCLCSARYRREHPGLGVETCPRAYFWLLFIIQRGVWCCLRHGIVSYGMSCHSTKDKSNRSEPFADTTGDIKNYAKIISVLDDKQKKKKEKQNIEADLTYATDPFHHLCTTTTGDSDLEIVYDIITHASERFLLSPQVWKRKCRDAEFGTREASEIATLPSCSQGGWGV